MDDTSTTGVDTFTIMSVTNLRKYIKARNVILAPLVLNQSLQVLCPMYRHVHRVKCKQTSDRSRISHRGHAPIRGGMDLQCGHFLVKMYAKMKELGPIGGGMCPACPPLRSANANPCVALSCHCMWKEPVGQWEMKV